MIAGGVGAVGLAGFLFLRSRRTAPVEEKQEAGFSLPMLYSQTPISGGISSDAFSAAGSGGASTPVTNAPGVSMDSLFTSMFANSHLENMMRIQTDQYTANTDALANINYGQFGGSAEVSHSGNTTTLAVNQNMNPNSPNYAKFLEAEYQKSLGRAPDAGGMAFWLDGIKNGVPLAKIAADIRNSPEALAKQKAATPNAPVVVTPTTAPPKPPPSTSYYIPPDPNQKPDKDGNMLLGEFGGRSY